MKKWIVFVTMFFIGFVAKAQYGGGPDRYFYDEDFDWRWDIRVRISDGYRSGYLTNREANRLYKRLEDIERKEWAYQADGYYSVWEQDEIWYDVVDLNRRIGIELSDWDRRYYGYSGVVITGHLPWYFGTSYDFYRFDRRGYGSIKIGYTPRAYYPVRHVYYTHSNNYSSNWNNNRSSSRVAVPSRNNSAGNSSRVPTRGYESSRTTNSRNYNDSRSNNLDYNRNSGSRTSSPSNYERNQSSRNSSLENSRSSGSSSRSEAPRSESNTRNNSSSSNGRVQSSRSSSDSRVGTTSIERSNSNSSGSRTATRSSDSSSGRGRN